MGSRYPDRAERNVPFGGTVRRVLVCETDDRPLDPEHFDIAVIGAGRAGESLSLWAIGDVAGFGEHTHVANRHARIVAAVLLGRDAERFDELAAALVTAIDGGVSVDRVARSMWPIPTIGEILGLLYSRAVAAIES